MSRARREVRAENYKVGEFPKWVYWEGEWIKLYLGGSRTGKTFDRFIVPGSDPRTYKDITPPE